MKKNLLFFASIIHLTTTLPANRMVPVEVVQIEGQQVEDMNFCIPRSLRALESFAGVQYGKHGSIFEGAHVMLRATGNLNNRQVFIDLSSLRYALLFPHTIPASETKELILQTARHYFPQALNNPALPTFQVRQGPWDKQVSRSGEEQPLTLLLSAGLPEKLPAPGQELSGITVISLDIKIQVS